MLMWFNTFKRSRPATSGPFHIYPCQNSLKHDRRYLPEYPEAQEWVTKKGLLRFR